MNQTPCEAGPVIQRWSSRDLGVCDNECEGRDTNCVYENEHLYYLWGYQIVSDSVHISASHKEKWGLGYGSSYMPSLLFSSVVVCGNGLFHTVYFYLLSSEWALGLYARGLGVGYRGNPAHVRCLL